MLKVRDLAINYRNTWAINDVSFSLEPGQVTGLLGPNGAGKSSLVKGILGLIPTARGAVTFADRPIKRQLKRVAYVPQRSQIDWDYPITVEKVVMMGRIPATGWFRKPSPNSRQIVKNALSRVGMTKYARHQIRELSGGQQQRVFLAKAIAQAADLLFFDEPFNNIDKKTEEIIFDVFAELKQQQKTLLVISHDLGKTVTNYDQLLLLNQNLIAIGSQEEVLTDQNLTKAYGKNFKWLRARKNVDPQLKEMMNLKDYPQWLGKQDVHHWN
ncbi:ATPase component of Mn/Zn ABC-type transporter [Xenococcus sp. PCC 7305]|uniref:metal ABC transporter ATP-binding protein n=1 Tax=Xenococcus sp. PCC 7305 TaxID=102125 RepID=UPI0002AC79FA|nr:metal ABC transporter ATP-binding protein [Xenococcus sp. PCC 7305]ELS03589.1 ATPase component of Mn/Zn ABC-type transporter [Xenococcus sp. PCC 7305]